MRNDICGVQGSYWYIPQYSNGLLASEIFEIFFFSSPNPQKSVPQSPHHQKCSYSLEIADYTFSQLDASIACKSIAITLTDDTVNSIYRDFNTLYVRFNCTLHIYLLNMLYAHLTNLLHVYLVNMLHTHLAT